MGVIFKILHFLCLSSATLGLQLAPSLSIKTPVGVDLGIGNINTNLFDNVNTKNIDSTLPKECFCIPYNLNSRPVISYLEPTNGDIERKVVYLYKIDGDIKVYIPSKNKQDLIPDLNFDDNEGDILIPVSTQSIVELFDPNIINPQHAVVSWTDEIVSEIETINPETNEWIEPQPINSHTDSNNQVIENIEYLPIILPDDNIPLEEDIPIVEQITSVDTISEPSNNGETINKPESIKIINPPNADQLPKIIPLPSKPQELIDPVIVINNQDYDVIPDASVSDPLHVVPTILPLKPQPSDSQSNVNIIPNIDDYNHLQEIISWVPSKPQPYPEQNPWYQPIDTKVKFNTFHDWFRAQLKHVVLYNLETPAKILELRKRIIKVLVNNGMNVSLKGIVTDSNGNLVPMNNIQLRPILIGSQIDVRNFLDDPSNIPDTAVSYVQFIEIILTKPPTLLGTLVMGTVYLPRNVHSGQNVHLWNNQLANSVQTHHLGCTTCKPKSHNPYSTLNELHYSPISEPYGEYYALPLKRNFQTGKQSLIKELPLKGKSTDRAEPNKLVGDDANRSGLGGVFESLLENLGITPTIITNPTRRLLGGGLPGGAKSGPQKYPNDALPGFRIVGGNAATSSGTPLANKGRSGFVKPSIIR